MLRRPVAFTLIEMLIVISIIAVLAGLLFPALAMINAQKDRARTQSSLGLIGAAIEQFKSVNGTYPGAGSEDGTAPSTPMDKINTTVPDDIVTLLNKNSTRLENTLKAHNPGDIKPLFDAWKNRFFYLESSLYPTHPDAMPHPDGFQLWSRGANGRNDPDTKFSDANGTLPWGGGDDLTNWK